MTTARKTISMPALLFAAAQGQMQRYGYTEFSDYIQALIRADSALQPGGNELRESSNFSPGQQAAAEIVAAAISEAKQSPLPIAPIRYRNQRRSKKMTPPKSSAT